MSEQRKLYQERCEVAQKALEDIFWNEKDHLYDPYTAEHQEEFTGFHYWWQAHVLDVLLDAYERTKDDQYIERIHQFLDGILNRNQGTIINELYDDMEWMALAFLRAYDLTGEEKFAEVANELWEDIQTGWNDICGGGIAWHKKQLYYKNTPANAPAVILALRLYQTFENEEDLKMAEKIFTWLEDHLVEPESGFIWDGMNREEDMKIDKDWEFTYCQGVYIGACVEFYHVTKDETYLKKAEKTTHTAFERLSEDQTNILRYEGMSDSGLFKGIFIRYVEKYLHIHADPVIIDYLLENGEAAWKSSQAHKDHLFGGYWSKENPPSKVTLSSHLSGCMLMESLYRLLIV